MNGNLTTEIVKRVTGKAQDLANQIADTIGSPVDASKLKRDEIVQLWNMSNPQADPMQIQQLMAQGQHAKALDMAYPWRNQLIGKGDPQSRVDRANKFAEMANAGGSS